MREVSLNKEAKIHRLLNQRRIAFSLIKKARTRLLPGVNFSRELHELFRAQGKFGSKDRKLYRELVYTYLRYLPWLDQHIDEQEAFMEKLIQLAAPTLEVKSLYPTLKDKNSPLLESPHRSRTIGREDHELLELLPDWFPKHSTRELNLVTLLPLFQRPPLWLRIQNDPNESVLKEIQAIDPSARLHESVPSCIHVSPDVSITTLPCFENGSIEIQDISSQVLLQLIPEQLRGNWLDACAGAGGKTLQLAKMLQPFGKVFAYEPRRSALEELSKRLKRSGFQNVKTLEERPEKFEFDGILVDAPCSGSGTWRRHPFLMRQTREDDVLKHGRRQLQILRSYAPLVKRGGLLIYSTCSLSRFENEDVRRDFLDEESDFEPIALASRFGLTDTGHGITVSPDRLDGDGLYIAAFRNRA